MSDTVVDLSPAVEESDGAGESLGSAPSGEDLAAIQRLVQQARDQGVALTGPDGLLKALTKTVIEAALDEEMSDHFGYDKHAVEGRNGGNSRNGKRSKTVVTDNCGEIEVFVPRDRDGSFEPQLVRKRQRRLSDVDEIALSLYAKGLTTGEISAHFADVSCASVSKDTVSRITDRVTRGDASLVGSAVGEDLRRGVHRRHPRTIVGMVKIGDGQARNGRSTPRSGSISRVTP